MLGNIIIISLRNLLKNGSHTVINVLGLGIGLTSALVIFSVLRFNLSFDGYHQHADRIYRLVIEVDGLPNGNNKLAGIPYPLRLSFQEDFPDIERLAMVDNHTLNGLVAVNLYGEQRMFEEDVRQQAFVMPGFFDIFHYNFLVGSPSTVFENGNSVVLSKSLAEKYFGDHMSAIGQVIRIESRMDLMVTGIVEDVPMNTDLPFNMLISFDSDGERRIWSSWETSSNAVQCYIKLKEKTDPITFSEKIVDYLQEHKSENSPKVGKLLLQPLDDVHHNRDYLNYNGRVATPEEILALSVIGLLLILAASINFINLNTAQAIRRSKEIGIRKSLGGSRASLIAQFLSEAALVTLVAIALSLGIMELGLLGIEHIIGYSLPPTTYDPWLLVAILFLFVGVTLLAGLYPAWFVSGYRPIEALENKVSSSHQNGLSLRKTLIVTQLLISQVLIVCVVVVSRQIDHFMKTPIGVDTEAVIEFDIPRPNQLNINSFKNSIKNLASVKHISFSNTGTSSSGNWSGWAIFDNGNEMIRELVKVKSVDDEYLETYGLALAVGLELEMDTVPKFMINEAAVLAFGVEEVDDVLGAPINVWGIDGIIAGVVRDFHAEPLHEELHPIAFLVRSDIYYLGAVKLAGGDWLETIEEVRKVWERQFPGFIFSYNFLDDKIAAYYENERITARMFVVFAGIAIFISGIGLFGLTSYLASTRKKEIGVRKVLGARVDQIISLLSIDFTKLVFISFLLAAPISWYFMNEWLHDFATRIDLSLWIFVVALASSIVITLSIVGYRALRAALVNPADSLKDE